MVPPSDAWYSERDLAPAARTADGDFLHKAIFVAL
jgi:hypothetical protein